MFRWCSYCQQFLGETDPINDYQITHGICSNCKSRISTDEEQLIDRAKPMVEFFASLRNDMLARKNRNPTEILSEAIQLGISPVDLLAGIMQPLLYDIFNLQSAGKATIRHEHEFSILMDSLLIEVKKITDKGFIRQKRKSDVLLACAEENYHVFGVRIIEEYLLKEKIVCQSLFPSLPFWEIIAAADEVEAKIIGISVVTPEQAEKVLVNWKKYLARPKKEKQLRLILGGYGVCSIKNVPPNSYLHTGNLQGLKSLVQTLIAN